MNNISHITSTCSCPMKYYMHQHIHQFTIFNQALRLYYNRSIIDWLEEFQNSISPRVSISWESRDVTFFKSNYPSISSPFPIKLDINTYTRVFCFVLKFVTFSMCFAYRQLWFRGVMFVNTWDEYTIYWYIRPRWTPWGEPWNK